MTKYYGSLFHSDLHRLKMLTRSEMIVYSTLIAHGGKKRTLKLSQSKIAKLAGVSLGSTKRALSKFEKMQWIESRTYFQIKSYVVTLADDLDQSSDLDQSNDLGHSSDPYLDHSLEPSLDHSLEPHVINSKKEEQLNTCTNGKNEWSIDSLLKDANTQDEILFVRLFQRWSLCSKSNWSTPNNSDPLMHYKKIKEGLNGYLNLSLELKLIDSWLLMQRTDQSNKHWRSVQWIRRLENWLQSQLVQGARSTIKDARISNRQRGFYDYSISELYIPTYPPEVEAPKVEAPVEATKEESAIDTSILQLEESIQYVELVTGHGKLDLDKNWLKVVENVKRHFFDLSKQSINDLNQIDLFKNLHNLIKRRAI